MQSSFALKLTIVWWVLPAAFAVTDEPEKPNKEGQKPSVLFKRFLHSMSLTPLRKKADSPSPTIPLTPALPADTKRTESRTPPQPVASSMGKSGLKTVPSSSSDSGSDSGSGVGSSSSSGTTAENGMEGQAGSKRTQAPPSNLLPKRTTPQSGQPNLGLGSSRNASSQAGSSQAGSSQTGSSQTGSSQGDPAPNSGVRSSATTGRGNASAISRGAAVPGGEAPATTSPQTGSSRGAGYVLLGWEIVRPAGSGLPNWASSIAIVGAQTDDIGNADTGYRLESGVQRSSLQTGPKNLLVLPPNVASVVYVLDCSGSMVGGKFDRVQDVIVDAVSQMQPAQKFALILFNTSALQIRGGGYRDAGATGAAALQQELAVIAPTGGTEPADALMLAIQLKPETVVILSDGEFDPLTVDRVTRLNRLGGKNTQINCVAIGSHVQTLQRLASLNGPGNYVEIP